MTIMNYSIVNNISSDKVFLTNLKNFLQGQGWTIKRYLQGVQWAWDGAQYDFIPGTEDYLEVNSAGYGSQVLHFRFRIGHDTDTNDSWLDYGAFHSNGELNHANSQHPIFINSLGDSNFNQYYFLNIPKGTIPTVWFFGIDSKFCLACIKCDTVFVNFLSFGSIDLFDTTETQGQWAGYTTTNKFTYEWFNYKDVTPFDRYIDRSIYYNNAALLTTNGKQSFLCQANNTTIDYAFSSYSKNVIKNSFSQIRPITKQIIYIKDTDNIWFPLGTFPVFRIWSENYKIGYSLRYDTNEYLVFPMGKVNERFLGVAVQVS